MFVIYRYTIKVSLIIITVGSKAKILDAHYAKSLSQLGLVGSNLTFSSMSSIVKTSSEIENAAPSVSCFRVYSGPND
jgi:hypothetical protein